MKGAPVIPEMNDQRPMIAICAHRQKLKDEVTQK
jgi:hypothetical protein